MVVKVSLFMLCVTLYCVALNVTKFNKKHNYSLLQCVKQIAHQHSPIIPFTFLQENIDKSETAQDLIKIFDIPITIQSKNYLTSDHSIYIFFYYKTHHRLNSFLNKINYSDKPRFLIVLSGVKNQNVIEPLTNIFLEFWQFKFLRVLVLFEHQNNVYIYTYFPYSSTRCSEVGSPVLVDVWESTKLLLKHNNSDIWSLKAKLNNLHGCNFRCIAKNRPPDSIIIPLPDNQWYLSGNGGLILQTLMKKLNFTPSIIMPENTTVRDKFGYSLFSSTSLVISDNLIKGEQDIAFGTFSHLIYYHPQIEFSHSVVSECFRWCVPCASGSFPSFWQDYYKEFSYVIWTLILFLFLLAVAMLTITSKIFHTDSSKFQNIAFNTIYIWAIVLNMGISPIHQLKSMRFFLIQFSIYSLIIAVAYEAALKSFLTVPEGRANINNWQEIDKLNLKITGVPQAFKILENAAKYNKILQNLCNKFNIKKSGEFSEVIEHVVVDKDTAIFGAERFMLHYSANRNNILTTDPICPVPKCVFQAYASPFLLRKGSPLLPIINDIIYRLSESGITSRWWIENEPKNHKPKPDQCTLVLQFSFSQVKGVVILLLIGHTIAFLILVIEILYYRYNIRKKIQLNFC